MKSLHIAGMLALLAAPLIGATQVGATTKTATMQVSATVPASCTLSTGAMAFGNLNPSADNTATASVTVNCTAGAIVTLTGDWGSNNTDGYERRFLKSGAGNVLDYSIWLNNSRTVQFTPSAAAAGTITGNGSDQTITLYGFIAQRNLVNVAPAAFTDTVTLTLTY